MQLLFGGDDFSRTLKQNSRRYHGSLPMFPLPGGLWWNFFKRKSSASKDSSPRNDIPSHKV
jgi:hypothetical protein